MLTLLSNGRWLECDTMTALNAFPPVLGVTTSNSPLPSYAPAACDKLAREIPLFVRWTCSEWLLTKNAAAAAAAEEKEAAELEEAAFVGPEPLPAEQRGQGGHGYGGALRPGKTCILYTPTTSCIPPCVCYLMHVVLYRRCM